MVKDVANYICQCKCHTDEEHRHEGRCCFKCPKCHDPIVIYLYNEHKAHCRTKKRLQKRQVKAVNGVQRTEKAQEQIKRPPMFGSTRSRHRRRLPVGR